MKCIKKSNLSITLLDKRKALGYQKFNWDLTTPQHTLSKTLAHDNGTINRDPRPINVTRGGR